MPTNQLSLMHANFQWIPTTLVYENTPRAVLLEYENKPKLVFCCFLPPLDIISPFQWLNRSALSRRMCYTLRGLHHAWFKMSCEQVQFGEMSFFSSDDDKKMSSKKSKVAATIFLYFSLACNLSYNQKAIESIYSRLRTNIVKSAHVLVGIVP